MIKINLLRHSLGDARRIRRMRRVESTIALLGLGAVCLVLGLVWVDADHRIHSLQQELESKRMQVASHLQFESEVKALLEQKEKLIRGLSRFEEIQRLRMQPVIILETVSINLDPLDLWLATMQLEKGHLALTGFAGSRHDILRFSKNINEQQLFRDVIISETRTEWKAEEAVHSFTMNLRIDLEHADSTPS